MANEVLNRAAGELRALHSDDPAVTRLLRSLGDSIQIGNITGSTGIAIGRDIRLVVNQFNLPAGAAAALLDARSILGGLDAARYGLGSFIRDKTADFVGRAYAFSAITDFLESHPNGYLTIRGDPGLGKSTLLAEYVRRTGCIAHFNARALGIIQPAQFIEHVCAQIVAEFGLPYAGLPPRAARDGAFLARLLDEASQRLPPGERLVIAVDALDEVAATPSPPGANVLFLPPTLPRSVYFIMTRRDVDVPFVAQAPQGLLDLMAHPAENRLDVEAYLRNSAGRPKIRAWIKAQPGLTAARFVSTLADKSENNFMYLRYVLPDIEGGAYRDLRIERLPAGLQGYYENHWQLMGMTAKPLPRLKIMIIYLLSEARLPVSRQLLTKFLATGGLKTNELAVQAVLDEWEQFLHKEENSQGPRYSLYHASFRDFLNRREIVQAAGVTLQGINAQVSRSLTASFDDVLRGW